MNNKTIGFIGLGNMASAIIGGMLQKGVAEAENIIGFDVFAGARENAKNKFDIHIAAGNCEAASQADILFLAVKPIFMAEVIAEIKDVVKSETVIVSIAAGKTIDFLEKAFCVNGAMLENAPEAAVKSDAVRESEIAVEMGASACMRKIIRCMPNTPALVLEGCTGVTPNANVTEEDQEDVLKLLSSFGKAYVIPERLMDAVVGVSGSSPAYVFIFIEAMADAAVAAGMPRKQAYDFAAQAVLGSAKMVLETGMHPGELKDMVCSPGGTTIDAVKVLEEKGFRAAVMNAMEVCIEKSKKL